MKKIVHFPHKETVDERAALWIARLDQGSLSQQQKQELQVWLNADDRHLQALKNKAKLWVEMDELSILSDLVPLPTEEKPEENKLSEKSRPWFGFYGLVGAGIAAVVALLIIFGGILTSQLPGTSGKHVAVYLTDIGQQSRTALEDGSVIKLNTQSRIRVHYTDDERLIYLERGEGFFEVAKNPERPFIVYAGMGLVRAVGTAFSVRLQGKKVDVAVSQGIVEVIAKGSDSTAADKTPDENLHALNRIQLRESGIAQYEKSIEVQTYLEPEKMEHKLAWINGKWIFDGESLSEVIEEANRFTTDKIEIHDPEIASLRIGGYFDLGEVGPLLTTLEHGFDIDVDRSRKGVITLSRKSSHEKY